MKTFDHDHDYDHDHVGGRGCRWGLWGVMATCLALLAASGCAAPMCVPDGSPACECTVYETRDCTADGGLAGIQACSSGGFWTACVAYMDGGLVDHQPLPRDTGSLPDFGNREF